MGARIGRDRPPSENPRGADSGPPRASGAELALWGGPARPLATPCGSGLVERRAAGRERRPRGPGHGGDRALDGAAVCPPPRARAPRLRRAARDVPPMRRHPGAAARVRLSARPTDARGARRHGVGPRDRAASAVGQGAAVADGPGDGPGVERHEPSARHPARAAGVPCPPTAPARRPTWARRGPGCPGQGGRSVEPAFLYGTGPGIRFGRLGAQLGGMTRPAPTRHRTPSWGSVR